MAFCPNLSLPEVLKDFNELKSAVGETAAYGIWNENKGNHYDRASNGKPSNLFNDILNLPDIKGNRVRALHFKAKLRTNAFKDYFKDGVVDENGEPKLLYRLEEEDIDVIAGKEATVYTKPNVIQGEFNVIIPVFSNSNIKLDQESIRVPSGSIKALFNDGSYDTKDFNIFYQAQKPLSALPLKNNEELYKKYNLLNKDGNIKALPYNTAIKWAKGLNEKSVDRFKVSKTTDGKYRVFIVDENAVQANKNVGNFAETFERTQLFQTSDVADQINREIPPKEIHDKAKTLESKLLNFLQNNEVVYRKVKTILDGIVKDPLNADVTAIYAQNVVNNGKSIKNLIEVLEGTKSQQALPEETAHFAVSMIRGTPLYDVMFDKITEFAVYNDVVANYSDFYEGSEVKLKEEAMGKLIADLLVKKEIVDRPGLTNMANNWVQRIINYLKGLFKGTSTTDEQGFNNTVEPFLKVVDHILSGEVLEESDQAYSIPDLVMPQKLEVITEATRALTLGMKKKVLEERIILKGSSYITTEEIPHTVLNRATDDSAANTMKFFKGKDISFSEDNIHALKGTVVHSWKEVIADEFNSVLQKVNSLEEANMILLNKTKALMADLPTLRIKVNARNKENLEGELGEYKLEDIQTMETVAANELLVGTMKQFNDIYKRADNINKRSDGDFSRGDRPIILPEVRLYDKTSDTGGTIDLLVINPNATIDKYDYKTKSFSVNPKTGIPAKGYQAIQKEGFDIQLSKYNDLLESGYGIDLSYIGASRIIPINVAFNTVNGKINPKGFKYIQDVYTKENKRDYLKALPASDEQHFDENLNANIENLFKQRSHLLTKLKRAKGLKNTEPLKIQLTKIEKVLQALLVDNDLYYVYKEIRNINDSVKDLIRIPQGQKKAMTIRKALATKEYLLNYTGIASNANEMLDKIEDPEKRKDFKNITYLLSDTIRLLTSKITELVNSGSSIDVTKGTEELNLIKGYVAQIHEFDQPYIKRLYELISVAEAEALDATKSLIDNITVKDKALKTWAKKNRLSKKQAFTKILNTESMNLIGRFSTEHGKAYDKAREDANEAWMRKYTNMYTKEFYDAVDEGKKKLEEVLEDQKTLGITPEEIKYKLFQYDNWNDPRINKKSAFSKFNRHVRLKEMPEAYSKEWKYVLDNEPLLDYYNTYLQYNAEFSKLLDIYINPRNVANVRASLGEKLVRDGVKGVTSMVSMLRHSFEVREYEPESTYIDKNIRDKRRNIPVHYMDSIRRALSNSEYKKITDELDADPNFVKGSRKYLYEYRTRIDRAEFEKGKEFKSFDLTRSLILFGQSVYTNRFYSDKEDVVNGIREIITSDQLKVSVKDSQNKLMRTLVGKAASTISGVTNTDLKIFDAFVDYYVYGQRVQNKDHLFGERVIKDKDGNEIATKRALSTNKVIRSFLSFNGIKALALKPVLAFGNAIGIIANIYIAAEGGQLFGKEDVKVAMRKNMKKIFRADPKVHALINYVEPSARNITKEKANNTSMSKIVKFFTMDNLFFMHKHPDDFADNVILATLAEVYGLDSEGKLVKVSDVPGATSIMDLAQFDKDGNFSIKGLERTSKEFIKFKDRMQYTSTRIKGSIPSEASNLLGTNIYIGAATQFRKWIKGLAQARFGKVKVDNVYNELEGGRINMAFNQLMTHSDLPTKVTNFLKFSAEVVRMGIPFSGKITKSLFSEKNLNKKAIESYHRRFLLKNKLTEEDVSQEEFIKLTVAKIKELSKELAILLQLTAGLMLLKASIPDDKDDPRYLASRYAYKLVARGAMEMGFWFESASFSQIINKPIPSMQTIFDIGKLLSNTGDVALDIFKDKNNPNRAFLTTGKKDKKPIFYETQKMIPGLNALLDLVNYYDKPLQTYK